MKKVICVIFISLFLIPYSLFSQTWQTYDSLRIIYQENQNYDTALVYAEKALQLVKEKTGENNIYYANMLTAIMEVNYYNGNYPKAIEYCKKEIEIRKSIQGMKHPDYALSVNNLALLYVQMGNYTAAEPLYLEAKNIRKEVLGEKSSEYAESLNNLATLYDDMGSFAAAEPLYIGAININKVILGEKHPEYANNLNNLGYLYNEMGNFVAAEPLYLEATKIRKEILGDKHPDYAFSLSNLSRLYCNMGNYTAAEPLAIEAKNIFKEVLGEKHPYYASTLNNLAALYDDMGNYIVAEPLYLEAKNILKEVLGENHPEYAQSLNNLGLLYQKTGNYSKAETLFIKANEINKEVLGTKHINNAILLNNLAELYQNTGNYIASEPLYLEAINIQKEILGENHPNYAISLDNFANLYNKMGKYFEAESLLLECLGITNQAIVQNFTFLSEKEKEMYFKTIEGYFSDFYSLSLKRKNENCEITKTVFNNVVKNKGLLLKSSTAMRTAILNGSDTSLMAKYNEWIMLRKEISKLYSTEISKRNENPEELEQHANILEKELVKGSQVFSDFEKLQNLTWEDVKNSLKQNEAAVEFIRFKSKLLNKDTVIAKEDRPKQSTSKDEVTSTTFSYDEIMVYCALIITPQSKQPEMMMLFEEKQILAILNSSSGSHLNQVNNIYGTNVSARELLYKLIWQPMENYLKGVKTVYYSPDGILHKVSFASLGKSKNIYLCDQVNLQQVSSTGKVAMPENAIIDKNLTVCIMGGIDYSSDSLKNSLWQYLPGTLTETNAIKKKLLENNVTTKSYSGIEATELLFKNIYSNEGTRPEILHIATHGFFYPDPEKIVREEMKNEVIETGAIEFRGGNSGYGLWQFVKNKNPLMRSGLVMAGANKVWFEPYSGTDNEGVLTAQEVTQLDMTKTKLVVLSACETGLGDIKGSEGVYGLQRAFKMAGVKFIVMSLWQVPDKETVEFMEIFYTKLLKQKDVRIAFNETQKEMRKKYDPYYWASFVLVE